MKRSFLRVSVALLASVAACAHPAKPADHPAKATAVPSPAVQPAIELASLHDGDRVHGFVAKALYVDDEGRPRGARFVHQKTGFVFDDMVIESAPQAMVYAWTYPPTEAGEPHTQEHLLLGKGNAGRWLGNVFHASFTESSAFTADRRTVYHFHTSAGPETFWRVFDAQMRALLHPDYSDEEIRREVANYGVSKRSDGKLALDEKGTVYNEMVRTTEGSNERSWYAMLQLLYGEDHPLSNNQGGKPEAIRDLTPERIRAFHAAHYRLGNMGATGAFPSSMPVAAVLARMDAMLDAFATPGAPTTPTATEATLPPTHPAAGGTIRVVEYPYATKDNPAGAMLAWPATRKLDLAERTVLEEFMSAFASGRSSNLYRAIVDRKTRAIDLGATDVSNYVRKGMGEPVYVGLENVGAMHADEASMRALRELVRAELEKVAAMPDGSKELAAFDERVKARIADRRRQSDKMLDTPPQFGVRGTNDNWLEIGDDLARAPGFVKSLTYKEGIDRAEKLAESAKNEWRDRIRAWGLLEAPYVVVGRASPELRATLDREREERVAQQLAKLEARFATHDAQDALRKRLAEIDAASDAIAKAESDVPLAPLAPDPPMTNDDGLAWKSATKDGVPRVASTFETMKSATVGMALKLDDLPDESLPWLAVLPQLASHVGVIRDGKAIPYDEVEEQLQREVLGVSLYLTSDWWSGRADLQVTASGNDAGETKRAVGWAHEFLFAPDWRVENLPRIRDVVEERLAAIHRTMEGPEEYWVESTEEAYRRQDRAVLMHAQSFLTQAHDALVVSWRLEGGDDAKGVAPFLKSLGAAGKTLKRDELAKLAAALASEDAKAKVDPRSPRWVREGRALPKGAQSRVRKAGRDLGRFLADVPDASLASDWAALCDEMADGVARSPRETLDALAKTMASIRRAANARLWVVGASKHQDAIAGDVDGLVGALDHEPAARVARPARRFVRDRAHARGAGGDSPFVALINPSTANGSLVHTAPSVGFDETRDEALVGYLAVNVFGGEGTQSFYKRMWGAALAYSDYVYASPRLERMELYADRCADMPALLRFGEAEVRRAKADPKYVDYAVVPAFGSRAADAFEWRAEAMAIDLVDGRTPDRIRAFRQRLLALRTKPGLAEAIHAQYATSLGKVIPALAGSAPLPEGALYFTTGPEAQIDAYENEIARTRGEGTKVLRLWPRDFWDVAQ